MPTRHGWVLNPGKMVSGDVGDRVSEAVKVHYRAADEMLFNRGGMRGGKRKMG